MRIGIVCPYSFDVPGGVQAHVRDLAEALIGLGHSVSVLAPAEDPPEGGPGLASYVVSAGRAVGVPYNGSVARVAFGPISLARVRRWLREGHFDVLHVHEPIAPSLSLLACVVATGPIVATFHTATQRSRTLAAVHSALQPILEKVTARIAVSALARRVQVEHMDGGAVEIPNGVAVGKFERATPLPGWPGEGGALGFLGRFGEPRKGFPVLADAFAAVALRRPGLRLLVAGPGDAADVLDAVPRALRPRVSLLGTVSETDKARMLRSIDLYVAPNTGGESFGMILTEAMAAGATIVASDLDAFRRVLDDGRAGMLFRTGDALALAACLDELLDDPTRRAELAAVGQATVEAFDWPLVAARVVDVYASAVAAHPTEPLVTDADDWSARWLPKELRDRLR